MDNNYNTETDYDDLAPEMDIDPVRAEYQTADKQKHWVSELEAARKERKKFDERGDKTIKRYSDERGSDDDGRSFYNVFFANTEIKMAALYARTPSPSVTRRFSEATDDVSRVAANLLQRSISYELETQGFDDKIKQILFDRLVPGVGIGWARLDQTEVEPQYEVVGIDPETGEQVSQPIEGSEIADQLADIDYVPWNDFLWSPCRTWSDCYWVTRRIPMSKEACKARFSDTCPAEVLRSLPYSLPVGDSMGKKDYTPKNATVETADVYEIWDKENGLIWWIAEGVDLPLDVQEDRMQFEGFYPTPLPPLGRFTTSSTIPISDFKLVQDQYNELDTLNDRAAKKLRAIRTLWTYDASQVLLQDLFSSPEFQGIPVKDWQVMQTEKGGLNSALEFIDNTPVVNEYLLLVNARASVAAQIFEIEGITDIQRGVSQQYESATATSAKGSLGSTRLAVMQKDTAEYIARLLRLKAHLICKFYKPEFIVKRAGVIPEPDQQYLPQALQLLQDDQLNGFRLLVTTDSIQLPNMNQHKREKSEALQALTALLGQVLPAAQQNPAIGVFGGHAARWLIADYPGSEGLEGYLDQFLDQSAQAATQAAQQPPKPTDAEMKAQAAMQAQQLELQKAQMREQSNIQVAQIQAEAKKTTAQLQAQIDAMKAQFDQRMGEADIALRAAKLQIEGTRAAHENAVDLAELGA